MARSFAQNAIALLIDLAERGEIDPWDVKVIDVVDRFLSQLQPGQSESMNRFQYESELSESGQAFLYASVLVLLKADSLARADEDEETTEPEEELLVEELSDRPLPTKLERRIRRRATAQPPQNRRVTLQELIDQLEVMTTALADHRPRPRNRRSRAHSKRKAVRAITQLAHQENLSEIAAALEQMLNEIWPELSEGGDWLDFEALLDLWATPAIRQRAGIDEAQLGDHVTPQGDRVGVFWALLFLSSQSKVDLHQTSFYQDLKVRSLANENESVVDLSVEIRERSQRALPD